MAAASSPNNHFTCLLEKRSRSKGVFSKLTSNWQSRTVVIQAQELSYYAGAELKGTVNISKCHVELLGSDAATDSKPFPFELQINKESMLFSCASSELRTNVVEILMLASKSPDWINPSYVVQPEAIPDFDKHALKKGFEHAKETATLQTHVSDFKAVSHKLRLRQAKQNGDTDAMRSAAACMIAAKWKSIIHTKRKRRAISGKTLLAKRDRAVEIIQNFYRHFSSIKSWRLPTFSHPFLMKIHVGDINFKIPVPNQNYIVVLSGVNITTTEADATEDARLNSGVCITCDHTRLATAPIIDQNVYVGGVTSLSYLIVTVLKETTLKDKNTRIEFVGQGSVKLDNHQRELFVKYRPVEVAVPLGKAKVQIRKDGGSFAEIGQELQQSGSITITMTIPHRAYNMAGPVTKLTETLVASNFKKRYFVLCDGVLSYFGTPHSLDDVKHFIRCEDILAVSEEVVKGQECWVIKVQGPSERERGESWVVRWGDSSTSYRNEWMRKILRASKKLPNPDLQEIKRQNQQLIAPK